MLQLNIPRKYSLNFSKYVLSKVVNDIQSSLSRSSYIAMDEVVKEFVGEVPYELSSYSLVMYYIRTLYISEDHNSYKIMSNNSERINGSDKKLDDVIRLIEYGVAGIKPVPRITTVFNRYKDNIDEIYKKWIELNKNK